MLDFLVNFLVEFFNFKKVLTVLMFKMTVTILVLACDSILLTFLLATILICRLFVWAWDCKSCK